MKSGVTENGRNRKGREGRETGVFQLLVHSPNDLPAPRRDVGWFQKLWSPSDLPLGCQGPKHLAHLLPFLIHLQGAGSETEQLLLYYIILYKCKYYSWQSTYWWRKCISKISFIKWELLIQLHCIHDFFEGYIYYQHSLIGTEYSSHPRYLRWDLCVLGWYLACGIEYFEKLKENGAVVIKNHTSSFFLLPSTLRPSFFSYMNQNWVAEQYF